MLLQTPAAGTGGVLQLTQLMILASCDQGAETDQSLEHRDDSELQLTTAEPGLRPELPRVSGQTWLCVAPPSPSAFCSSLSLEDDHLLLVADDEDAGGRGWGCVWCRGLFPLF